MTESKYLVFTIKQYFFGIHIEYVSRVIDTLQTHSLPMLKANIEGFFTFDNRLVSVVNISESLGIPQNKYYYSGSNEESVIILKYDDLYFAFRVETVEEITTISDELLQPVKNMNDLNIELDLTYFTEFIDTGHRKLFVFDAQKYISNVMIN